jgi:addiction module HigA family antidote
MANDKTLHRERKPTHPGQLLSEHYLKPRHISILAFAEAVGHSRKHISAIINGRAGIEAELATRIAAVLGTTAQFWLNAQNAVDLWQASRKKWKPGHTFLAQPFPA